MKIAVITPIKHLKGLDQLLESKGQIFYHENDNKEVIKNSLIKNEIQVLLCNPNKQDFIIDKSFLEGTNITLINTCSTGTSHIDLDYCERKKIKVLSLTKDFELINDLPSTSELAFGLMLDLLRNITNSQKHVKSFKWDYTKFIGRQVKDLKIGVIGFGRLGKLMYKYCKAFEADVSVYDPKYPEFSKLKLEDFISKLDVISIHVHLDKSTINLIDKNSLRNAKNDLIIINTSRGKVVNEIDLIDKLIKKEIGGYGTDVLSNENDDISKSKLIKMMNSYSNIIITPHIGGMTYEGQNKAYKWAINKL